jgi:hypothetical protein
MSACGYRKVVLCKEITDIGLTKHHRHVPNQTSQTGLIKYHTHRLNHITRICLIKHHRHLLNQVSQTGEVACSFETHEECQCYRLRRA